VSGYRNTCTPLKSPKRSLKIILIALCTSFILPKNRIIQKSHFTAYSLFVNANVSVPRQAPLSIIANQSWQI
jgi:hypothetical protein